MALKDGDVVVLKTLDEIMEMDGVEEEGHFLDSSKRIVNKEGWDFHINDDVEEYLGKKHTIQNVTDSMSQSDSQIFDIADSPCGFEADWVKEVAR